MKRILEPLVRFLQNEDGPTAVEYAVMLGLIIIVCIAAIVQVGKGTCNNFNNFNNQGPWGS